VLTPEHLRGWLEARPRVLDGAGAGELLRRGVVAAGQLWGVGALLDAPEEVRRLHRDYAAAGAEVLTALTFRVAPYSLRRHGLEERAAELAAAAVRLAREGAEEAGRKVLVVASMTTLEDCYRPDLVPDDQVLLEEHAATAHLLATAGADALLLETFNTIREAVAAVDGARATGLPVIVSFACCGGGCLLSGEEVGVAAAAVSQPEVAAVGINCTAVNDIMPALSALAESTHVPLAVYANNGYFAADAPHLAAQPLEPERYARCAQGWVALGAHLLGGCCGTSPAHVAAVAAALATPPGT
jgi:S-methylmethionine-dependent homocysteine/selenocysteine methylase